MNSWLKDYSFPGMHARLARVTLLASAASLLWVAGPAWAQRPSASQQTLGGVSSPNFTTLLVSVRDSTGGPLPTNALVRISSNCLVRGNSRGRL